MHHIPKQETGQGNAPVVNAPTAPWHIPAVSFRFDVCPWIAVEYAPTEKAFRFYRNGEHLYTVYTFNDALSLAYDFERHNKEVR